MLTYEQIELIQNDFLQEAIHSPRLLMDMASMESYLAESYGERILIELLQNADDAQSTKAILLKENGTVIFANNGRPFSADDHGVNIDVYVLDLGFSRLLHDVTNLGNDGAGHGL